MASKSVSVGGVTIKGLDKVMKLFEDRPKEVLEALDEALQTEAKAILETAVTLTPKDTGKLRESGKVDPTNKKGSTVSTKISFGGSSAPYALYVHEDMTKAHPLGQAKFLEIPTKARSDGMSDRIAEAIEKKLSK